MTVELMSPPEAATLAPPVLRPQKCFLDSPESKARLLKKRIKLTEDEIALFRQLETTWPLEVLSPSTGGCLVNGKFGKKGTKGYFSTLDGIVQLGRDASIEQIVSYLASRHPDGLAFVLFASAVCQAYSDLVAHEAYRQIAEQGCRTRTAFMKKACLLYTSRCV